MMNCQQLKDLIIKPALLDLLVYSDVAMELLVFTCAAESRGGTYLKQIKGPALGIYQMEPATYNDIWVNYIYKQPGLLLQLTHLFQCNQMPSEERMLYDLRFATAMARIHYLRIPEALPAIYDIPGLWKYYKTYYNTAYGKADELQAISNYRQFNI